MLVHGTYPYDMGQRLRDKESRERWNAYKSHKINCEIPMATPAGGSAPLGRSWRCTTWWVRSLPRSAGGRAGALPHGLISARPGDVHGLQPVGDAGDSAPGIVRPGADPALGSVVAP